MPWGHLTILNKALRLKSGINFIFNRQQKNNIFRSLFCLFDGGTQTLKDTDTHTHSHSVVGHVSGGGAELGVGLDDLVDGIQEVFLCGDLPASADGEHACLCAHTADLGACQETHTFNLSLRMNRKFMQQNTQIGSSRVLDQILLWLFFLQLDRNKLLMFWVQVYICPRFLLVIVTNPEKRLSSLCLHNMK